MRYAEFCCHYGMEPRNNAGVMFPAIAGGTLMSGKHATDHQVRRYKSSCKDGWFAQFDTARQRKRGW